LNLIIYLNIYQFVNNNKNRNGIIKKDWEEKGNIENISKDNAALE
jgi:hypothetical protein